MEQSTAQKTWIVNPAWDLVFIHNIIWLFVIFAGAYLLNSLSATSRFFSRDVYFFVHWGHGLAPIILFWLIGSLRRSIRQNPRIVSIQVFLFFFVFGTSTWAVFFPQYWIAEFANPMILLSTLFFIWNTFHCGKQHFGVLSIYRGLPGQREYTSRKLDYFFTMGITCVLLPIIWLTRSSAFGILSSILPPIPHLLLISQISLAAAICLTTYILFLEWRNSQRSIPRMLYIFTLGIQPALSFISYPIYHVTFFIISHAIVEIGLCSKIFAGYFRDKTKPQKSKQKSYWQIGFWAFLGLTIFISWFLALNHFGYSKYIMPLVRNGNVSLPETVSIVDGLGLVLLLSVPIYIVFTHFLHDAYFWAFRKKAVRETVGKYIYE